METIPVFKPLIGADEIRASTEALEMGWLGMGSYVAEFERELQSLIGARDRHVCAVSTGHAALHLALLLAGVGPGDEVITPSFNNVADFQAILAVGASPVLCDVDDNSLCIDPDRAEDLVSQSTKALIATDYACMLCDHSRLAVLARKHGLRLIHDAAHSLGSRHNGLMVGSFSDLCTFSFDPVKTITCIDGGALVVRESREVEHLHEMRLIGMGQRAAEMYENRRAWTYDVRRLGFRYHMANLHAAVGLAQLAKLPDITEGRRAAARYYTDHLAELEQVRTPATAFDDITPFLYYVRVPAETRRDLRAYLGQRGIDTGIHWQPGHNFSLLRGCRRGDLSVTERLSDEIVTLPLHPRPSLDDLARVVGGITSFYRTKHPG